MIGGFVQELFGSYDCPPFTIVNTFEVDGKKVLYDWEIFLFNIKKK